MLAIFIDHLYKWNHLYNVQCRLIEKMLIWGVRFGLLHLV